MAMHWTTGHRFGWEENTVRTGGRSGFVFSVVEAPTLRTSLLPSSAIQPLLSQRWIEALRAYLHDVPALAREIATSSPALGQSVEAWMKTGNVDEAATRQMLEFALAASSRPTSRAFASSIRVADTTRVTVESAPRAATISVGGTLGQDVIDDLRLLALVALHGSNTSARCAQRRALLASRAIAHGLHEIKLSAEDLRTLFPRTARAQATPLSLSFEIIADSVQSIAAQTYMLAQSHDGAGYYPAFDWGATATQRFLPRLRFGRTVVSKARWSFEATTIVEALDRHADGFFQQFSLPNIVCVSRGSHEFPIDLTTSVGRALVRDHALRHRDELIVLEEYLPTPGDVWLTDGRGDRYRSDFTVRLVRR